MWRKELEKLLGNKIKEHEPLTAHVSTGVGGVCSLYVELDSLDELIATIKLAHQIELPYFILGSGYGTLLSENSIEGLVIKNMCRKYDIANVSGKIVQGRLLVDKAYLYAESGALFSQFVRFSLDKDYSGLEDFLGFPGTVGEVVKAQVKSDRSNIAITSVVKSITILSEKGEIEEIEANALLSPESIKAEILAVVFTLYPGDHATIWDVANAASQYHAQIQEEGTILGQVFHDFSKADAMRIPTPSHTTNVSYLLDQAGLKGKKIGGAKVSVKQSNYIVTNGIVTYADIKNLIDFMKKAVYDTFRVKLTSAITIVDVV